MQDISIAVHIWNLALDFVGETIALDDENDERPAAEVCRRHYLNVLRRVLEKFPWPFARCQAVLVPVYAEWESDATYAADAIVRYDQRRYSSIAGSNTGNAVTDTTKWTDLGPIFVGWDYVFGLPLDCVTPLALLPEGERLERMMVKDRLPFEVMSALGLDGKVLCTNAELEDDFEVLEYTTLNQDVSAYTGHFVEAVAWALAKRLAIALRKDSEVKAECDLEFRRALSEAKAEALNARQEAVAPMTPSLQARM